MDATFYLVSASGNYSISYGWDDGLPNVDYVDKLHLANAFDDHIELYHQIREDRSETITVSYRQITDYGRVIMIDVRENSGSRTVKCLVLADNESDAEEQFREWVKERYSPI